MTIGYVTYLLLEQ